MTRLSLPRRVLLLLMAVIACSVTACGAGAPNSSASGIPASELARLLRGRVILPPCETSLPVPTPPRTEQEGFGSAVMSSQVQQLLGFQPQLPRQLPTNVTWNLVYVESAAPADDPSNIGAPGPWLHAAYRLVNPRLQKFAPSPPSVLTLDETSSSRFAPTSYYPGAASFQVASQTSDQVGSASAMLYHLAAPQGSQVLELVWHAGYLAFRMTAVAGGAYQLAFTNSPMVSTASPTEDTIVSWSGSGDQVLLSAAQSLQPYTGCHSGG
jgi:hypothetical protein